MPFQVDIRLRLQELKSEFASGLLPQVVYEELCRKAIGDGGAETMVISDEASSLPQKRRKQTKKEKRVAAELITQKIMCPIEDCDKELKDVRGLSSHLLASHRRSINEFIINPDGSGNYVTKPDGWVEYVDPEFLSASVPDEGPSSAYYTSLSSLSSLPIPMSQSLSNVSLLKRVEHTHVEGEEEESDHSDIKVGSGEGEMENKIDKRKFNKGQAKRKSYDKHLKLQCIAMRDDGKSADEVAHILNISKGHIEKWCSPKNRERTLLRATAAFQTSSKTINAIKDAAEAATIASQQQPAMCYNLPPAPPLIYGTVAHVGYGPGRQGGHNDASVPGDGGSFIPLSLPGMNAMSMVGALSNYTASLSSNTTLLRDGQTLSGAVPSGLSVSAGSILGLNRKIHKRDRKRKILDTVSGLIYLGQKVKKGVSGGNGSKKMRGAPGSGLENIQNDSDSDDEDGVMELLGESRTRKPPSSSSSAALVAPTKA